MSDEVLPVVPRVKTNTNDQVKIKNINFYNTSTNYNIFIY